MKRSRKGGRVRERWLKRKVSAAVKDAMIAFCGTPSDERLWAKFAWRCGYGRLLDAVYQGEAEMSEHETEIPNCDKPKVLQAILNRWWRALGKEGGGRRLRLTAEGGSSPTRQECRVPVAKGGVQ